MANDGDGYALDLPGMYNLLLHFRNTLLMTDPRLNNCETGLARPAALGRFREAGGPVWSNLSADHISTPEKTLSLGGTRH